MNIISKIIEVHIFRIINDEIEFLLLKRSNDDLIFPGLWQMVSGSIDGNETAYNAALRELKEETGLIPELFWIVPNVNSFYSQKKDEIHLVPVFAAKVNSNSVVKLSVEHSEFKWVKKEEAKKLLAWDGQKKSIDIITDYYYNHSNELSLLEIKID